MADLIYRDDNSLRDLQGKTLATLRAAIIRYVPKLAMLILSVLVSLVTAEATARVYWRICCGVPLLQPDKILYAYYPELRSSGDLPEALQPFAQKPPAHGDGFYNILFLGGSVLHSSWGSVEMELREQLASEGYRNVRIFNLAMPAHTSRDSLLKYAALGDARFDLVIFYHGINDARVNNAPPGIFREDYSHYSWYEAVNTLAPYHGTASFALPYTVQYLALSVRQILLKNHYLQTYVIPKDWVHYGENPRSAVSFQQNLEAILDLASHRKDRILVMTFAIYVAENYSREAFNKKRLDYLLHRAPIEWWGRPEYVLRTVAVHNEIVRRVAARYKNILFVDQARLMKQSARCFDDPVHLTLLGSHTFVENVVRALGSDVKE